MSVDPDILEQSNQFISNQQHRRKNPRCSIKYVEIGPIWNQGESHAKANAWLQKRGMEDDYQFTGQWKSQNGTSFAEYRQIFEYIDVGGTSQSDVARFMQHTGPEVYPTGNFRGRECQFFVPRGVDVIFSFCSEDFAHVLEAGLFLGRENDFIVHFSNLANDIGVKDGSASVKWKMEWGAECMYARVQIIVASSTYRTKIDYSEALQFEARTCEAAPGRTITWDPEATSVRQLIRDVVAAY